MMNTQTLVGSTSCADTDPLLRFSSNEELPQDGTLPSLRELIRGFPEWESCGRTRKQGFVTRVKAASLTYDTFFARYLLCNEPVVIEDVATSWRASEDWIKVTSDDQGAIHTELRTPNVEVLVQNFGGSIVQVCN